GSTKSIQFDVTGGTGGIFQIAGSSSVTTSGAGGNVSFSNAGSGSINLAGITLSSAAGGVTVNSTSSGTVVLGAVTTTNSGGLSVSSKAAISQSAPAIISGTTTLTADTNAITANLSTQANNFNAVSL